jgi:hypothetical protein
VIDLSSKQAREKCHQALVAGLRLIRPEERVTAIAAAMQEVEAREKRPLRCSKRHAVPRGRSGRASPKCYCSPAVNAGGSFQRLIGAIIGHEGIVNFVEIGGIIFHGNLRKIPSPLIWHILQGFGTMTYVTQRGVPI